MQGFAGEAAGGVLEGVVEVGGEVVGLEEGGAGLEGRGDCVFEGHVWVWSGVRREGEGRDGVLGY